MQISIIAAVSANGVIGSDNDMPWHIPEDLRRFKEITSGHHVIMGRNTYESIGKPLPNRTNIIITRNKDYKADGCIVVHTLQEALGYSRDKKEKEVFIIGGGQIYDQTIQMANKIYLTRIQEVVKGDTYFPFIDFEKTWTIENLEAHRHVYEQVDVKPEDKKQISSEYAEFLNGQVNFEFMNLVRKARD